MKIPFQILTLFLIFKPLLSFSCNSVSDSSSCSQLTGCVWTTGTCSGGFTPSCSSVLCYYIDPINGSDTQDGSVQTPFKTLSKGLNTLSGLQGTLTVLNYENNQQVEILGYTKITSSISIEPLFNSNSYILSLSQFDTSTANNYQAISVTSGKLRISGLTINNLSIKSPIQSIFELGNAQLSLNNVILQNGDGSTNLVNVSTASTSAQLNFTGGSCTSSTFGFQLLAGSHTFNQVTFNNISIRASSALFNLAGTLYINNTIINGGEALFVNLQKDSLCFLQNVSVNGYTGNLIDAYYLTLLRIDSSTFYNLNLTSSLPFIRIRKYFGPSLGPNIQFTNLIFSNINVKNSLFLAENSLAQIIMTNITVTNLFKKPVTVKTAVEIDYESSWPGGIFFLGRNGIALTMTNCSFYSIGSHCIGLNTAALILTTSIFDNSGLNTKGLGSATDQNDAMGGVTWINMERGTSNVMSGTQIRVSSSIFNDNKLMSSRGGALRFTGSFGLRVTLANNTFQNNKAFYGGAVYSENPWIRLVFSNELYSSNSATIGGAIYKSTDNSGVVMHNNSIQISGTTFQENTASDKGGAIYLDQEAFDLENSAFISNHATHGGAICFVRISKTDPAYGLLRNNTFISNTATKSGGAIKVLFKYDQLNTVADDTSVFIDNTDSKELTIYEGKLAYYLLSFYSVLSEGGYATIATDQNLDQWIANPNLTSLAASFNISCFANCTADPLGNFTLSHKSGHSLDQILVLEIYDQNGLLADYVDNEQISINIVSTQNNINNFQAYLYAGPLTFTFTKGKMYIKTLLTLMGQPTTTATLSLSSIGANSDFIKLSDILLDQDLQVHFRDCERGDVFNSQTKMCETCPKNTYILADPYSGASCLPCDTNEAICLGGGKIAPQSGYWRYDPTTAHMIQCPKSSACLGGYTGGVYDPHGKCEYPYEGNLCSQCAPHHAKPSGSDTCVNCETDALYYIKSIGFLISQIGTAFYSVRTNIQAVKDNKKAQSLKDHNLKKELTEKQFKSNIIRIAINYVQICSLILQLKFEWPTLIKDFLSVTNNIAPTDQSGFSFDCLISLIRGTNEDIYFIDVVIILVKPLCMWLILLFLEFLWIFFRKDLKTTLKRLRSDSIILLLIPSFLYQTGIIQATFELFRCQNFSSSDNPRYFMVGNPEVQCWTKFHLFWCLAVGLPNLLAWAVVLPAIVFRMLWKKAKDLHDPKIYAEYSFIYLGLKPEKYFWEFITLLRKLLIVIAFVFLNIISIATQVFVIFLIIAAFGSLHFVSEPYSNPRLNTIELYSLIVLAFTASASMTLLTKSPSEWFPVTVIIIAFLLNVAFFVWLAYLFVKSYKLKAKQHIKNAHRVIKKISQGIDSARTSMQFIIQRNRTASVIFKSAQDLTYKIDSPKEPEPDFVLQTTERHLNKQEDTDSPPLRTNSDNRFNFLPSEPPLSPRSEEEDEEIGEYEELILYSPTLRQITKSTQQLAPVAEIEESRVE